MDVEILDHEQESRYELRVDGALAGLAAYRLRPPLIAFTHTEVEPAFEGHGLAARLVAHALAEARARGLSVLPFCPYVRGYIAKHPDQLDLVPHDQRSAFDLPTELPEPDEPSGSEASP